MATPSSNPRIRRVISSTKSPAYEFPPIFDEFRRSPARGGTQTASPFRPRRSSQRRLSQARTRSQSRPRATHGGHGPTAFFNRIRNITARDVCALVAWLLTLGAGALSIVVLFNMVSFFVEHTHYTTDTTQLQKPECFALSPVKGWCWLFPNEDAQPKGTENENSFETILGDYTGIGASAKVGVPFAQIYVAEDASKQTRLAIRQSLYQVEETERLGMISQRGKEVSSLLREWYEKHQTSAKLFESLLSQESAFRESALTTLRRLARSVAKHEDALVNSSIWTQLYVWVPSILPYTAAATITRELEPFARQQAIDADELAALAREIRNAVKREDNVRAELIVTLPINVKEFGEEVDFETLQNFLQHGAEAWSESALDVATAFRKQYRRLSERYFDVFVTVRKRLSGRKDRAALVEFLKANVAGIKQSLAVSEGRLAASSPE